MKQVVSNATNFKATCLGLLDEIDQHGGTVTITKRGRPVATLGQVNNPKWKSTKGAWAGKSELDEDLVNFHMDWEAPGQILNPSTARPSKAPLSARKPGRIPA